MKKSKILGFSFMATTVVAMVFLVLSCKKETATVGETEGFSSGCDYQYGTNGYIVQEDGIINFQNASTFFAFIDTVPTWSDSTFVAWETSLGSNTAYGNYIEADNALTAFMTPYENDTVTTEAAFQPTFNAFAQSKAHLASVTAEGVEPYFTFPFYYFVNEDGIYRICSQEYSVQGSLLLSYPVGKQDLVKEWNGQVGEFGELSVQQIQTAMSNEEIQERDEEFHQTCTATYNDGKKRIKVWWDSSSWHEYNIPDAPDGSSSGVDAYWWAHQVEIKAQKKWLGIWWSDKRHIAVAVNGTITNRHQHEAINYSNTVPVSFFRCKRAHSIKEKFASEFIFDYTQSTLNNFAMNLTVTGTNRRTDCQEIQATCTMNLVNL